MSIGNIVVADATTPTPVNHTFVPVQDGADARYINEAGAMTLAGQETLSFAVKRSANGKDANTVRVSLWDPTEVEGPTGVYTVDHGSSADCRLNFAVKASLQERKNLVQMAINALTAMKDEIANLRPQI